jgi:plasmid stability protein
MPVSLSIKNVPDEVVVRLRERAARNRRSLQGELLAVVEEAAATPAPLTIDDLYERAKARGLTSKSGESARIVRQTRDARTKQLMHVLDNARGRR